MGNEIENQRNLLTDEIIRKEMVRQIVRYDSRLEYQDVYGMVGIRRDEKAKAVKYGVSIYPIKI